MGQIDRPPVVDVPPHTFTAAEPPRMDSVLTGQDKIIMAHTQLAFEAANLALNIVALGNPGIKTADQALASFTRACDSDTAIINSQKGKQLPEDKAFALLNRIDERRREIQGLYEIAKRKEGELTAQAKNVEMAREAIRKFKESGPDVASPTIKPPEQQRKPEVQPSLAQDIKAILSDLSELFDKPEFKQGNHRIQSQADRDSKAKRDTNLTGATGFTPTSAFVRLSRLREVAALPGVPTQDRRLIEGAIAETRSMIKDKNVDNDVRDYFETLFS